MIQQIVSFETLYSHINDNGLYLCEDLHTSYWEEYGGGYKKNKSFIEYSKNFIDYINAWHSKDERLKVNEFTRRTNSIHYYDSVIILEKKLMSQPVVKMTGEIIIPIINFPTPDLKQNIFKRIIRKIINLSKSK